MNIYLVAEGKTEAIIYGCWVPFVNKTLKPVHSITEVDHNCLLIISAKGYPDYLRIIADAISDIQSTKLFQRLVIVADSENLTKEEKLAEIHEFLNQHTCTSEVKVVIQHFCIETWALANRKIIRSNTSSLRLRSFKIIHDVRMLDPELLPPNPSLGLTRVKFAALYLKVALNDRNKKLTYIKSKPTPLLNHSYFEQVKSRYEETSHIKSFTDFLSAFIY